MEGEGGCERERDEGDGKSIFILRVLLNFVFGAHSGNAIGPEGGKALAVPLEKLTALQQLDLRCSKGGDDKG